MSVKRCPICRLISPGKALRCDCGYAFGQSSAEAEEAIEAQLGPQQAKLALCCAGLLFFAALAVALPLRIRFVGVSTACGVGAYRSFVRLRQLRASLRELPRPPEARVMPQRHRAPDNQ